MRIYVPSRDRWAKGSTTLAQIPKALHAVTLYVVPSVQVREYKAAGFPAVGCPANRIAPTRQWILEHCWKNFQAERKLVMLDDDLTFFRQEEFQGKNDIERHILSTIEGERAKMFNDLDKVMNKYAHASIAMRLGANRFTNINPVFNTRMARVLGLRVDVLRNIKRKWFGDVAVQDDFYLILQLLTLGYPNCVITEFVQEQKSSNAPGGASTYRDMAFQADSVRSLQKLFPEYVRVVEKETKVAWNGQARLDVVVAWKKAYEAGCRIHGKKVL